MPKYTHKHIYKVFPPKTSRRYVTFRCAHCGNLCKQIRFNLYRKMRNKKNLREMQLV